jgi:hypothetical protein
LWLKASNVIWPHNDLSDSVTAAALDLYRKVAHNTLLCGDSEAVDGFWIETHTLGCRNAADDPEDQWQVRHEAIYHEYANDGRSIDGGATALAQ